MKLQSSSTGGLEEGGKKSLPHNLVHEAGNRALEREQM